MLPVSRRKRSSCCRARWRRTGARVDGTNGGEGDGEQRERAHPATCKGPCATGGGTEASYEYTTCSTRSCQSRCPFANVRIFATRWNGRCGLKCRDGRSRPEERGKQSHDHPVQLHDASEGDGTRGRRRRWDEGKERRVAALSTSLCHLRSFAHRRALQYDGDDHGGGLAVQARGKQPSPPPRVFTSSDGMVLSSSAPSRP